jgi:LmbE family N-acetylglucosaminyl deacetylase
LKVSVLSPHIDDAAFGLTLTISKLIEHNVHVQLINCFTKTKWTGVFVSKDIEVITALRKQEDAAFNQCLGSKIEIDNLDLLDAPLRNNYIHQFHPFNHEELQLIEQLKAYLRKNCTGFLLCPLAIGNHIDHAICREAVNQLYPEIQVLFFEDLPYAQRITSEKLELHVEELEQNLNARFINYTVDLNNCNVDKKRAINIYKSQIDEEICSEIIAHQNRLKGERLWGEAIAIQKFKQLLS